MAVIVLFTLLSSQGNAQFPNEPPFADAGWNFSVAVGETAYFHGEGYDEDGKIVYYEWDYDDDGNYDHGSTESGEGQWIYQALGEYRAVFRVTDNDDATDIDWVEVTVVPGNDPPTAEAGEDKEVHAKEFVTFEGTGDDPDGHIALYEWDFDGDGNWDTSSKESGTATWMYTKPGTYEATFRVTDNGAIPANATDTIEVKVYEANLPPTADAGPDQTVHAKETVHLSGTGTDIDGKIVKYEWDLDGDGTFDRESTSGGDTVWKYDRVGTYTAVLRVTDNADLPSVAEDSCIITVKAENKPPTVKTQSGPTVYVNEVVQFKATYNDPDGEIVKYEWDFDGDGKMDWSSGESGQTNYIYTEPGTYPAEIIVTDDVGAQAKAYMNVTILPAKSERHEQPLVSLNFNFIIALIIGLVIGLAIGAVIVHKRTEDKMAEKYKKLHEIEARERPAYEFDSQVPQQHTGPGQLPPPPPPTHEEPPTFRGGGF
jgi:hypothetical protein